jgi:Fur family ferric uptake transcriptional regulator
VVERQFKGGATQYELIDETHHDHLICTQCGTIIEFEDDAIEAHQERIAAAHRFELHSHRHELYGVCARCRRKGARG